MQVFGSCVSLHCPLFCVLQYGAVPQPPPHLITSEIQAGIWQTAPQSGEMRSLSEGSLQSVCFRQGPDRSDVELLASNQGVRNSDLFHYCCSLPSLDEDGVCQAFPL